MDSRLSGLLSIRSWIPDYEKSWLRGDVLAGLTAAAVVIPQAMAYAGIATLPVQVGLYTALAAGLAYALLGTSRCLSVSVTSTASIIVASTIAGSENPLMQASLLALMVGVILVASGFLGLGFIARYISKPVLAGFKAGAGLIIAASQLERVLGFPVDGDGFFGTVAFALMHLGDTNGSVLLLASATVVGLLGLRQLKPGLPASLLVIAAGVALIAVTDLEGRGVTTVGTVPAGLPAFRFPGFDDVAALIAPAFGIALMVYVESIAAARAFRTRDEPRIDSNQEMIALGGASLAAGLFQGYPAGGGLSQTAVNRQSGAHTQIAGVVTVGVVVLTVTVLTGFVGDIPNAVLGGIVIVAAIGLVDLSSFREIEAIKQRDYRLAILAFLAVLTFGILEGVLAAVLISMARLLWGINHADLTLLARNPESGRWGPEDDVRFSDTPDGALVVRPYGRIYFGNVEFVVEQLRKSIADCQSAPDLVVIDCSAIPDFEVTGLLELAEFVMEQKNAGIRIVLARVSPQAQDAVEPAEAFYQVEPIPLYDSVETAIREETEGRMGSPLA